MASECYIWSNDVISLSMQHHSRRDNEKGDTLIHSTVIEDSNIKNRETVRVGSV